MLANASVNSIFFKFQQWRVLTRRNKPDISSNGNTRTIGLIPLRQDYPFLKVNSSNSELYSIDITVPARWLVAFHEMSKSLNLPEIKMT